jgi:hypothetical protein
LSRFPGWTEAAIAKLNTNYSESIPKDKTLQVPGENAKVFTPDYCAPIVSALQILGITAVREYKFLHDRRFKFDIAIPAKKVAIEFEGGIYGSNCKKCKGKGCKACDFTGKSRGRHTRGQGYSRDCKKYNLAVMHGWKLLRYTTDRTAKLNWEFEIAEEVKMLIKKLEQ